MKQSVNQVLDRMRAYVEADGAEVDLYFVDEDFGVVELLLRRRSDASNEVLDSVRNSVSQMILRQVAGVRQVDFLADCPPDPRPSEEVEASSEEEFARMSSGLGLVRDMLLDIREALRGDLQDKSLRRMQSAEHFLSGPYSSWLEQADARLHSTQSVDDRPRHAPFALRDTFSILERTARAFARMIETERGAWGDEPAARSSRAPQLLAAGCRENDAGAQRVLNDLRPLLGERAPRGFLPPTPPGPVGEIPAVENFLDRIFSDAARGQVRDVYIDLGNSSANLQYRIGRAIEPILSFPERLYAPLVARIKNLASLDVAERRRRQEGMIRFTAGSGYGGLTVQVQTIPGQYAERVRLRLKTAHGLGDSR